MEKIKSEIKETKIENKIETEEKEVKKENQKDDFSNIIALMQKQIDEQKAIIEKQKEALAKTSSQRFEDKSNNGNLELLEILKSFQNSNQNPSLNMVKVICLEDCGQAMFKLQNGRIVKFTKEGAGRSTYGKIVPISMEDAILLLNQYTGTFERGALKFDEDHMYMLKEKGIDIENINYQPIESFEKFTELDKEGIEKLYKSLRVFQKEMLKSYIVKLINSGKVDESFIEKIKILNKFSKVDSIDGRTGQYEMILGKLKELGIE